MKQIADIKKFSFAEMTSNSDGKTSGAGVMGIYVIIIGGIGFILGCIDKLYIHNDIQIISESIIFTGIGATLMGVRLWQSAVTKRKIDAPTTEKDNITTETENK